MSNLDIQRQYARDKNLAEFIIRLESHNANINIPLLRKAYEVAETAHQEQMRDSGVPYIDHCREVAAILGEWHLDSSTIAAGLLHDSVEDTGVTIESLKKDFGDEIAHLVDGVTKLSAMKYKSHEEQQAEYFRKMLLSMARDIRVILIKLADRMHNMQTLEHVPAKKRLRIAQETQDIYAPMANRFGIAKAKVALEDLSFKYLEPEFYRELANRLDETRDDRERYIAELTAPISEALSASKIKADVSGRAKHLYSICRKIRVRGVPFEDILDLSAIRIIVGSVHDCYHVLGVIHAMWKPAPDKFDDYVASPKPNGYQSLHTTVVGIHGRLVEIQIRTREMHYIAENGIAAHWLYKEGKKSFDKGDQQMVWLRDVLEWQNDMQNPAEFLEYLKIDLFPHDIYVFTPNGKIIHLPTGATPLDFAFAVHSEVGMRCAGAKINDRIAPLATRLKTGDIVEVITHPQRTPSRDWLQLVITSNARSKIRRWLKKIGHDELVPIGKDLLERELRKVRISYPLDKDLLEIAESLSHHSVDSLLASLGNGDMTVGHIVSKLTPEEQKQHRTIADSEAPNQRTEVQGVNIQGHDDMFFRLASCCQPIPGDEVIGYVTRGRGVTVHRSDCPNLEVLNNNPERQMEVNWDVRDNQMFRVRVEIRVADRKNMLRDITQTISDSDANLRGAEMHAIGTTAKGLFSIDVHSLDHLQSLFLRIKKIQGVIDIQRSNTGSK
ncbi:bifunctional (p)ppGpp synthetase/guanosine-3',5'-bis(diphosphate) 3'-pyrophosphohydrolase [bacterium AH-315-J21]|nr:bifunctional (p)ppGpp synthetase/guanosine-3',5'-bis(diphosphate) 3'-pyrophosphohydrolase [bacterium AH-315-J21]